MGAKASAAHMQKRTVAAARADWLWQHDAMSTSAPHKHTLLQDNSLLTDP